MLDALAPELDKLAIVAIGAFNPAVFQPSWLARQNLIRLEEAEKSDIKIINKQAAIFTIEWFSLQVIENSFNIETGDPTKSRPLLDFVIGTFKILEHTPIEAFGLNRYFHCRIDANDDWNKLSQLLAPMQPWQGIVAEPALLSLTIAGRSEASAANEVQIRVEPSAVVTPGVFVQVHQNFKLAASMGNGASSATMFVQMLQSYWDDFLAFSRNVPSRVLTAANIER